ncbi:MAG TPA: lysylphosphatidylglycerol synthase domain-containing protein [Acidimicrobiales bacterium]
MSAGDPGAEDDVVEGPADRAGRGRRIVQGLLSLAVVGVILWVVLGQFTELSDVWDAMRSLTAADAALLGLATVWNLVTYWVITVIATPGLTYPQAAVLTESTTAVSNALPAGSALGVGLCYGMLGSWGFSRSRATLSVIVTGIWNNFAKLGMPVVALSILALQGQPGGGRVVAALLGLAGLVGAIVVFALVLRSEDFARRAGLLAGDWASAARRIVGRGPVTGWDHAVLRFRGRVVGLVRQRWRSLTLWTVVGHLSLFAVLLVALRAMGVSEDEVGWAEALATFAFARLLTAVPLTPGGVGIVELALIAGLRGAGGDDAPVVAAVLTYRLLTYVLAIALGAATYLYWRRNRSWLGSAPPLPASMAAAG